MTGPAISADELVSAPERSPAMKAGSRQSAIDSFAGAVGS